MIPNISIISDKAILQIRRDVYEQSYYEFFLACLKNTNPTLKFQDNWHIKYLCDELQLAGERAGQGLPKLYDLVINVPPRSMKSTIVTIMFNAWLWIKYPHLKIISTSYSGSLATEHCQKSRAVIESNWYQELFNNSFKMLKDNNQKTNFENDKTGHRQISSVGMGTTGKGGDIIIFDDLLTPKLASTQLGRDTMKEYYFSTMFNRLDNQSTGLRIIVEQRLHENDLTGILLQKNSKIKHICLPVELGDNLSPIELKEHYTNNLLFANRFDSDILTDLKKNLGSSEYATQYLQQPAPDEGVLFKKEWLRHRFDAIDLPENITRHFYSDTAYGDNQKSDYNATIVYSIHENKVYVWDFAYSIQSFPDFIKSHKSLLQANYYTTSSRDEFEPKATGVSVVQQLKTEGINAIRGKAPVDSKYTRAKAKTPVFEAGNVLFLNGKDWSVLEHQMITFPDGANDDIVDALVGATESIRKKLYERDPEKVKAIMNKHKQV